jgi:hypothetical protein
MVLLGHHYIMMSSEALVNEENLYSTLYGQRVKDWYIKRDVAVFTFMNTGMRLEIRPSCRCGKAHLIWYSDGKYGILDCITDIAFDSNNSSRITIIENAHKRTIEACCTNCGKDTRLLCTFHN